MPPSVAVIGAGPAGLMAAEVLSLAGVSVHVYDAMPSVGRKFLLAGKGGLNITHAEPLPLFTRRYGERADTIAPWLNHFGPAELRQWVHDLGIDTFVGSTQRVFPADMKAAPLLRAWLHRLRHPAQGVPVSFHMRHRWLGDLHPTDTGWQMRFDTPQGEQVAQAQAVVLALGGGSWPRLGSDGAWLPWLAQQGVVVAPLQPSNCGFDVRVGERLGWSPHLRQHFAGQVLKNVGLSFEVDGAVVFERVGEVVVTDTGLEGSLVYAASSHLRDTIAGHGSATLHLNLRPDFTPERMRQEVAHPRGSRTLSSHLHSRVGLTKLHTALLHEVLAKDTLNNPALLAQAIGHLPITLHAPRPIAEAISSAGGVGFASLTDALMLRELPGVFCAGEMLDWEAPTGGYLLTACWASGHVAGQGVLGVLRH
jgi:uncharacterized flavoprotein (TIGR03862 family)